MENPIFSFGIATDVQYADKDDKDSKYYRESLIKMEKVIDHWNEYSQNIFPIALTFHLGDIIDGQHDIKHSQEDLERILHVFKKNMLKHYHVLGNHCLKLPREYVTEKLGLKENPYYTVEKENIKFVILDGTDVSTYGWTSESKNYLEAKEWLDSHPLEEFAYAEKWNAAIGKEQKEWLKNQLLDCKERNMKAIVLCHYPLLTEAGERSHRLWNNEEIIDIFEDKDLEGVVVLYANGHYHPGGFHKKGNISYWTVKGILEAPHDSNCYAIVHVYPDRLEIEGYGTEPKRTVIF